MVKAHGPKGDASFPDYAGTLYFRAKSGALQRVTPKRDRTISARQWKKQMKQARR